MWLLPPSLEETREFTFLLCLEFVSFLEVFFCELSLQELLLLKGLAIVQYIACSRLILHNHSVYIHIVGSQVGSIWTNGFHSILLPLTLMEIAYFLICFVNKSNTPFFWAWAIVIWFSNMLNFLLPWDCQTKITSCHYFGVLENNYISIGEVRQEFTNLPKED